MQKKKIIAIIAAILILGVILIITFQPNSSLGNNSATISLVHYVIWLIVLLASMVIHFQKNAGKAFRYAALWVVIGSLLFIGYNLKDEFQDFGSRLKAELIPHSGRQSADQIEFKAQIGGHFVIEAQVDGFEVRFLVDTGASDVILTPRDARKIGFESKNLSFDKIYRTANGIVRGAPIKLGWIKIGPVELNNVRASINGSEMTNSLLGMSFLSNIGGYEVVGDKLTLKR